MDKIPYDKDKKSYCGSQTIYYSKEFAKVLIIKKNPFYVIVLAHLNGSISL
jgi:hypothetical protein